MPETRPRTDSLRPCVWTVLCGVEHLAYRVDDRVRLIELDVMPCTSDDAIFAARRQSRKLAMKLRPKSDSRREH